MTSAKECHVLSYRVDWLEMRAPSQGAGRSPERNVQLLEARDFPTWYFFAMYDAVGGEYVWEDMHLEDADIVAAYVRSPETRMFTMIIGGWPQGFFVLDTRSAGICDISYFGLVKQAIGKGLGGWLLDQAIARGWAMPGVRKITVNTCTLDHPRALPLYESRGFTHVRSEERTRSVRSSRLNPQGKDK
ncbi:MAG: GNAT family N-acetyltransferase [Rhodobacteraceae bacterium]|nr:GNAT family N-acetyltransferase [Paracoccaceae bacterium]